MLIGAGGRILVLGGSLASPSHSRGLLRAIVDYAADSKFQVDCWDLGRLHLNNADPRDYAHWGLIPSDEALALAEAASAAAAFVLVSPVYHNSYSGLLKNALDHLGPPRFYRKPVGLASTAGGSHRTYAVDHLRIVVRGLGGVAIPSQLVTADQDYRLVRGEYLLCEPAAKRHLAHFMDELFWLLRRCRQLPSRLTGLESTEKGQQEVPAAQCMPPAGVESRFVWVSSARCSKSRAMSGR